MCEGLSVCEYLLFHSLVVVDKHEFVVFVPCVRNMVCRRMIIHSMLLNFRQRCICALGEEEEGLYICMKNARAFAC